MVCSLQIDVGSKESVLCDLLIGQGRLTGYLPEVPEYAESGMSYTLGAPSIGLHRQRLTLKGKT
jgi:hypothetical protein